MFRDTPEVDRHLQIDHLKPDLAGRAVRGGIITSAAQAAKSLFILLSTVALARLLTPEDFGLVAMVTAVTAFLAMFKDMGLSMATIQRESLTHRQVSTLFWINTALGLALTALIVGGAWGLVWFYGRPELFGIALGISGSFLIDGIAVQHYALLRRQMRYQRLAAVEVGAVGAGLVAAVAMALAGFTYWALVANTLVAAIAGTIGAWWACPWRPTRPGSSEDLRELLRFGANLTGFSFANWFARSSDDVLIGRVHGASELGLYQVAYQILTVPIRQVNQPVSQVAIPALARLSDDPERYRRAYGRMLESLLLVTFPLGATLILTADWLILTVLGERWLEAVPIFTALGLSIFAQSIGNTTGWLFITQDRTGEMLRWGFIGASIAVASFLIGLPWGAVGVALAYSALGITIRTPWLLWYVGRRGPIRTLDFYGWAWPAVVVGLGSAVGVSAMRAYTPVDLPLVNLSLAFVVSTLSALLAAATFRRGRANLRTSWQLWVQLRRRATEPQEVPQAPSSDEASTP